MEPVPALRLGKKPAALLRAIVQLVQAVDSAKTPAARRAKLRPAPLVKTPQAGNKFSLG
jgi:hypothetical protein